MVDDAKTLLLPVDRTDVRRPQIVRSVVSSALRSRRSFFFLLGPLLCGVICLWVKVDGPKSSRNMLAVLAWVLAWWVTEAVPLPIASLAPLFLFPLFGIAPADEVAKSYMDDVITMVLGSFIFALAVEQYNIQKRLALNITLLFCGEPVKPSLLILGICATSAFVSMWMHNVAAAVLMMPVATGILQRFPSHAERDATVDNFCRAVVLAVVYSVAIGGMSTLTGTGVNLILVGMWKSYFPERHPHQYRDEHANRAVVLAVVYSVHEALRHPVECRRLGHSGQTRQDRLVAFAPFTAQYRNIATRVTHQLLHAWPVTKEAKMS